MGSLRWFKPILIWTVWALTLAGLQTTVWPMMVGGVAAPQLWLNLVLYFILFRPRMQALLIVYGIGLLLAPFTSLSLGIFWLSFLILVPIGSSIRSRAFWPGVRYFLIGSLLLTAGWHFTSVALSHVIEKNPTQLHLFTRLTEILLTPLAAYPQFFLMQWLDRLNQDDPVPHFGGTTE